MTNAFETLARQAGDALLVVARSVSPDAREPYEIADAQLGAWCVLRALRADRVRTARGAVSKTRVWVLTHVASGCKLGEAMTRTEAHRALNALRDVPSTTRNEVHAHLTELRAALPERMRHKVPDGRSLRSDYERLCEQGPRS